MNDQFEALAQRVDEAIQDVKDWPEEMRKKALALKEAVEAFHAHGLKALVRLLRTREEGRELLYEALDDPAIYAMFLLHGIIKPDVYAKVAAALEEVRPYLRSHGGDVELASIEGATVYVRLQGACSGCSLSALTLKKGVEETIKNRVPEIGRVEMVEEGISSGYLPPSAMAEAGELEAKSWLKGPDLSQLADGRLYRFVKDGHDVILVLYDNRVTAFRNQCPHLGLSLESGFVDGHLLTCPGHGFRFDLTNGECLTAPHVQLQMFPVQIREGRVWVRPE